MSPSLVKWIPHSIAFSFQDWFMPEQDLRPGRASIAALGERARAGPSHLASSHLVWVFCVDIIDSVLLFVVLPLGSAIGKRPDAARRNASYIAKERRFIRRIL